MTKFKRTAALIIGTLLTIQHTAFVPAATTKLTFGYPTGWEYTDETNGYIFYEPNGTGTVDVYNTDIPDFDIMAGNESDIKNYIFNLNPKTSRLISNPDKFETYTEIRNGTLYRVVDASGRGVRLISFLCTANGYVYHFDAVSDNSEATARALYEILDSTRYSGDVVPESDLEADKMNISININGRRIRPDSAPVLISGRTLVPIRAVAENLGYTVDWNADTRTVTMTSGTKKISVAINGTAVDKNGARIPVDVPAQIIDSRTYLPLRAVAEAMDCRVEWNGENKTVDIYSQ